MPDFFVHPQALCESRTVGLNTRVWAFAHVLPGAIIGADCNIGDHVFVENDVRLGDRVTVKNGVQIWDGVDLGDDVFVGPNATFTNDPFPRSRHRPETYPRTTVKRGASIGANATILPGVTIGERALVGAGSVVTRDVAPEVVVFGNPAQPRRLVDDRAGPALPFSVMRILPLEPGVVPPHEAQQAILCVQGEIEVRSGSTAHRLTPAMPAMLLLRGGEVVIVSTTPNSVALLLRDQ